MADRNEPKGRKALKRKRPASVTWLALGVLTVACVYLLRAVLAIRDWKLLLVLEGVSPVYVFGTGLIWSMVLLPVFWGLWTGRRWGLWTARTAVIVFLIYFWLDRLLLYHPFRPDGVDTALPFWAIASVLALLFLFWTLGRQKTRYFFGRT